MTDRERRADAPRRARALHDDGSSELVSVGAHVALPMVVTEVRGGRLKMRPAPASAYTIGEFVFSADADVVLPVASELRSRLAMLKERADEMFDDADSRSDSDGDFLRERASEIYRTVVWLRELLP